MFSTLNTSDLSLYSEKSSIVTPQSTIIENSSEKTFSIKKNKLINNINNFKSLINFEKNNDKSEMGQKLIKDNENPIEINKDNSSLYEYDSFYEYNDVITDDNFTKSTKSKSKEMSLMKCSLSFPVGFESNYTTKDLKTTTSTASIEDSGLSIDNSESIEENIMESNNINKGRQNSIISTNSKTKQETLDLLLSSIHKLTSSSELSTKYRLPVSKSSTVIRENSQIKNFNSSKDNNSRKVSLC